MKIYNQDCLYKLKELKDNSVDSIVTDPPYGLSFMGKKWDYDVPSVDIWVECLRVLKPGGHLLSFAGSRTYHRMAVRIEDAGFEIRDQIMWIYGSGFPKSQNISKMIDKKAGVEREVISEYDPRSKFDGSNRSDREIGGQQVAPSKTSKLSITAPATDEAKQYEGWGTALKPAHEPIVMARKPFKGTVVNNVLEWGTGGINIEESRIGTTTKTNGGKANKENNRIAANGGYVNDVSSQEHNYGRFPANIILDKEAGKILDQQSGTSKSTGGTKNTITMYKFLNKGDQSVNDRLENNWEVKDVIPGFGDIGGASRFFYCPKTSKRDRNEGLESFEEKKSRKWRGDKGMKFTGSGNPRKEMSKNFHPTVKPTDLMLYLIRLVTPKGGITLDPFMGSGSTGKAAVRGGFDFIGIEREKEYIDIAKARIKYEQEKQKPDQQQKLF